VLVTISDKKIQVDDGFYEVSSATGLYTKVNSTPDGKVDYYKPDIITANDYYPFGMMMSGRKYTANTITAKYRFSINGQEKETELNENITTAMYWEYDSRLGRRWNVDPEDDESISPYACFENNPILMIDADGDTPDTYNENNGPDDEFILYRDGTYKKIGSKGGDIVDYIYYSNKESNCVPCIPVTEEVISNFGSPFYNPSYDEDGNLKLRALDYNRIAPGKWDIKWAQGEEGLGYIDLTDAMPGKGLIKAGGAFLLKRIIKTQIVKVGEKKLFKEAEKKVITAVASNVEKTKNVVTRLKTTTKKVFVRGNRTGTENTIKIITPDNKVKLINSKRVKELVPNKKNPGSGLSKVNYNKTGTPPETTVIPGSKGLKRTLTDKEKKLIQKVNN
jgi:RHS repeat-associated protein